MREPDIIVIGGGPAGMAAASEAARSGLAVQLIEMRPSLGGAIHRQPVAGAKAVRPLPSLAGRWQVLSQAFEASGAELKLRRSFIGIDSTGAVLIDNRVENRVEVCRPRVVILACGAVEQVRPRPGWQLPGVSAAGGLQVMLKEGRVPQGRVLLAGSGPLLLALAKQMAEAGNPPVAVVEAGNPLAQPLSALGLMTRPGLLADMAVLMMPLLKRRFAWKRETSLVSVEQSGTTLIATLRRADGRIETIEADRIGLHDGLKQNDYGLPVEGERHGLVVLRAGDVREVLGAHAAEADGRRAGREAVAAVRGKAPAPADDGVVGRERRVQARLRTIFGSAETAHSILDCADDTVICRCENRTLGDLKAELAGVDGASARELRLNGRFGMGACQGRFCSHWAAALMDKLQPDAVPATSIPGARWPLRPVSLSALADAAFVEQETTQDSAEGLPA